MSRRWVVTLRAVVDRDGTYREYWEAYVGERRVGAIVYGADGYRPVAEGLPAPGSYPVRPEAEEALAEAVLGTPR